MGVKNILLEELKKSKVIITKKSVACLAETAKGKYSSHNIEKKNPLLFIHAEDAAVKKIEKEKDNSKIKHIYIAGKGQWKIRQIAPCNECYNLLLPHCSAKTKLTLYEPNTLKTKLTFNFGELKNAYSFLKYSKIEGKIFPEIIKQLKKKTILKGKDLEFIASLRLIGIKSGISFYLTGSASGRTGITRLILKKTKRSYNDLDLIAVSLKKNRKEVENIFSRVARPYFGKLKNKKISFKNYFKKETHKWTDYYCLKTNKKIAELVFARSLKRGMLRLDFYNKNRFCQIS